MLLQQSKDGLLRGRLEWNMMCGQGRGEGGGNGHIKHTASDYGR